MDCCKHCGVNLDGGDIYEYFFARYLNVEKALETAKTYGWKETDKIRFSNSIIVQPDKGEQYSICPKCNKIIC